MATGCIDPGFDEFRDDDMNFNGAVDLPVDHRFGSPILDKVSLKVDVMNTAKGQSISNDKFACSVGKSMAGVKVGDQIRIYRNDQHFALFNVEEVRNSDGPDVVRMGKKGRERLGTSNSFSATLSRPVPAVGLSDEEAEADDEFVERLFDNGSNDGLLVIAPHGGQIERRTDYQAEAVTAALSCSSWICKGWKSGGGCYDRWHITTTKTNPRSFPGLGKVANRGFAYCVAFHGQSADGILLGGAGPKDLKEMLKAEIEATLSDKNIKVSIAKKGDHNSGMSEENCVNWLTAGGIGGVQIEQSGKVRDKHWEEVAEAVINVYSQLI